MRYALFTGCVAKGAGRELLAGTLIACEKLGIELVEMTDAACCGAGVVGEDNPMVADMLNARTFALAEEQGLDIMNICTTCQGVHRKAQRKLDGSQAYKDRVNAELRKDTGREYKGSVKIKHFYEVLLHDIGLEQLTQKVVRPLRGLKVGAFYGCYATRPPEVNDLADPDDPDELESLIRALGATPVKYDERLKCCGFPILMMNKNNSLQLSTNAIVSAKQAGADTMVTPCPLCHLNLDSYQPELKSRAGGRLDMPILHIPQLVALALGASQADLRLQTHIVQPIGALAAM
jgi:succinate dehydrogenase / fumarate reductase cytochrome b subunit